MKTTKAFHVYLDGDFIVIDQCRKSVENGVETLYYYNFPETYLNEREAIDLLEKLKDAIREKQDADWKKANVDDFQ